MTSKSRLFYDALFLSLRIFFLSFKPTKSVVVFDTALYSSINFKFGSQMQGCLFHYHEALWRKWSRHGIGKDEELLKWLKKTDGVASSSTKQKGAVFSRIGTDGWHQRIPLRLLSAYSCAIPNNFDAECFHWGLLRNFNARHPTFWVFFNKLLGIINSYCFDLKQMEIGQQTESEILENCGQCNTICRGKAAKWTNYHGVPYSRRWGSRHMICTNFVQKDMSLTWMSII